MFEETVAGVVSWEEPPMVKPEEAEEVPKVPTRLAAKEAVQLASIPSAQEHSVQLAPLLKGQQCH